MRDMLEESREIQKVRQFSSPKIKPNHSRKKKVLPFFAQRKILRLITNISKCSNKQYIRCESIKHVSCGKYVESFETSALKS